MGDSLTLDRLTDELLHSSDEHIWPRGKPEVKESWRKAAEENKTLLRSKRKLLSDTVISFFYDLSDLGLDISHMSYAPIQDVLQKVRISMRQYTENSRNVEQEFNDVRRIISVVPYDEINRYELSQVIRPYLIFSEGHHDISNLLVPLDFQATLALSNQGGDLDDNTKKEWIERGIHVSYVGLGGANMMVHGPINNISFDFEIVASLKRYFQAVHEGKIQIDYDFSEEIVFQGDFPNLYRCFYNLVTNSMLRGKATKLKLSASQTDSEVRITCTDNGTGLPNEDKIFKCGTTYTGGKGLGLFFIKQVIEAHNGGITALAHNGDTLYNGASFTINLPRKQNDGIAYPHNF